MSASATVDELYEQQIKPLSQADRLRLLALLAQDAIAIVQPKQAEPEKMTITERLALANYAGGRLFKTAEEVDAYIREERDSWER
jgi:hypothetical protein